MAVTNHSLFDTAIGSCGIVWSERGIVALQLPEAGVTATRVRLRERYPHSLESPPTPRVREAIQKVAALLEGKDVDLSSIELDFDGVPTFSRQVYEIARHIPVGCTLCYGDIAARLGSPRAARAVGQALGRNPWAIIVPCHRVLASTGKLTGFSAYGGVTTKKRLLAIESVHAPSS